MVEKTLTAMRNGGIFDQVGFGFHRYSTDAHWLVPHFEKMLYDQALLTLAYWRRGRQREMILYQRTAREILAYVQRDLALPEAGLRRLPAEDADSQGVEGKYYLWTAAEARLGTRRRLVRPAEGALRHQRDRGLFRAGQQADRAEHPASPRR